jgi:hypothetical protein
MHNYCLDQNIFVSYERLWMHTNQLFAAKVRCTVLEVIALWICFVELMPHCESFSQLVFSQIGQVNIFACNRPIVIILMHFICEWLDVLAFRNLDSIRVDAADWHALICKFFVALCWRPFLDLSDCACSACSITFLSLQRNGPPVRSLSRSCSHLTTVWINQSLQSLLSCPSPGIQACTNGM